ncbi:MAG: hypothetical protein DWQ08_13075 [Proteobacteria bacterium]|nr:MAG: hypothetical protein DWQ08_13075 [Pseudomonadota bacterium]
MAQSTITMTYTMHRFMRPDGTATRLFVPVLKEVVEQLVVDEPDLPGAFFLRDQHRVGHWCYKDGDFKLPFPLDDRLGYHPSTSRRLANGELDHTESEMREESVGIYIDEDGISAKSCGWRYLGGRWRWVCG